MSFKALIRACCAALFVLGLGHPSLVQGKPRIDTTRVVFIGDSLMAGFHNAALMDEYQAHSLPAVIAQQGNFEIVQPNITFPGMPPHLVLESVDPLIVKAVCKLPSADGTIPENACSATPSRDNQTKQVTNLAVPGATLHDALQRRPFLPGSNTMTDVILGLPGALSQPPQLLSQVEWAEQMEPTLIIAWLGSNDYLGFASSGGVEPLTDVEQFAQDYEELITRLTATGAGVLVANLAEVTIGPFFLTPDEFAKISLGETASGSELAFLNEGDYVPLHGVDTVMAYLMGEEVSSERLENAILRASEVEATREAIHAYNKIIRDTCRKHHVAMVDMHQAMDKLARRGKNIRGRRLSTEFLGGLFSLDGMHPSNTGNAILADIIIKALNRQFRGRIPRVELGPIVEKDPLVLVERGRRPRRKLLREGIDREAIQAMKRCLCQR